MSAPGPTSQSQSPASKKAAPASSSGDGDDFTRLHITPFDAGLVDIVIPASVRPRARNVSFHSVATFPENRYGYVDLPRADAERLKAKLNGSVLKGTKMRIENAHPEVREEPSGEQAKKEKKQKKAKSKEEKSSKKRKRGEDVDEGVLLTDRKVKRGWAEVPDYKSKKDGKDRKKDKVSKGDKDKKSKRIKSKYTDQDECLLKVRLPSGATKNLPDDDEAARKRRKKKSKEREVIVHEFENTTRFPSFLKGMAGESSRPEAAEFVEGKGWVDEDGNVVEPVASSSRPSKSSKRAAKKAAAAAEESDDTSSSGTSSSEDEEEEAEKDEPLPKKASAPAETSDTSSEESDDEDEVERSVELSTPVSAAKSKRTRPDSSSSSKNLTIKIPPPNTPSPSKKEVHPLEVLYKRKKPEEGVAETPAQAQPFTFFGGDGEDEDEEDGGSGTNRNSNPPMPMTPFTRQDFQWRNVRSAAPTPDTAHPSRVQSLWSMQEDEEEDDEDMDDAPIPEEDEEQANEDGDEADDTEPNGTSDGKPSSSDFQSWFWENRRDLNQSWMKRRKAAAKEKRHRENKARASKAV
jgi:hypothetical protein